MSSALNPPGLASFNEVLIKTVRIYPPLYINNRRAFENVDRNALWEEVAKKIGRQVTPEFAKKRWLQLRDRYRKELKIAISHGFSQPQKWSHFQLLKWLDPHLQGSLSLSARDSQDSFSNSSSFPLGDVYGANNTSLLNFANSLFSKSQEQSEKFDSGDSELLEDINPPMSAIQSVLAATEASAIAASHAIEKVKIEEVPSCQSFVDLLGQMKKNPYAIANADYPDLQAEENPSSAEPFFLDSSSSFSSRIPSRNEQDQSHIVSPKKSSGRQRQTKMSRNLCRPFRSTRSLWLRSRRRFKRWKMPGHGQKAHEESPTPNAPASCSNCSSNAVASWLDDEDMLFARIVGLRLKKMSTTKRKAVRAQISKLLDDEETRPNGFTESGASVSEWS